MDEYVPPTKGNALTGVRCGIVPNSGNYHFDLAGCDDCNVRDLARRPLEYVEQRHRAGYVRQPIFEAYAYLWATSAVRFGSYLPWKVAPTDPEVLALVELFRKALAEAALPGQKTPEFERIQAGLFDAQVCTSLSDEEALARMNELPSGTSYGWQISKGADVAPVPCDEKPTTHRHLIFEA